MIRSDIALASDGISVHFLESADFHPGLTPLLIVPGMMGIADHYESLIQALSPRRVIALSHRGLGRSGPVRPGEATFSRRCLDIEAVVRGLSLNRYVLYGFSRGVPMVVQHCLHHPEEVAGLVLHDCPPVYMKPSEAWRDRLVAAARPHLPAASVEAYWRDGSLEDLTPLLAEISCPSLLIRGEQAGSMLPPTELERIKRLLRICSERTLPHSAHEVDPKDNLLFEDSLRSFAAGISS